MGTHSVTMWLCIIPVLLITGSTGLVCYTALESLDLSCLLRWDCPHASPNITYTVQTKTQGDPWQDVPWCVWISSRSCDVSPVFANFELYNMVRVGVHLSPASTVWIKPHKFDYSDFTFSPPSVTVSWKDDSLSVRVEFPCAANRRCSRDGCCPVSKLIDPWTTVTVYSELHLSENQSRTVWTREDVSNVDFSGLSPDQKYCAVANFSFPTFSMAASPKSAPQCIQTTSNSGQKEEEAGENGMLRMLCLGIGLTSLFLLLLLTVFLQKPKRTTPRPENQPKILHDSVSLVPPTLVPVDPCDIHLELPDDHVSSEYSSSLCYNPNSVIGDVSDPVHNGLDARADYWDSGGPVIESGLESCIIIPRLSHSSDETCRKSED